MITTFDELLEAYFNCIVKVNEELVYGADVEEFKLNWKTAIKKYGRLDTLCDFIIKFNVPITLAEANDILFSFFFADDE